MSSKTIVVGPTTMGLLGVAFIVLKLTHVIDWSWWLVTAPFWGPLLLFLVAAASIGLTVFVIMLLMKCTSRR